ncbi:hypothetical protein RG963_02540 [Methanosarcina sp. Z-7115]|uniref:Uncharacterized protein n=1 Tax=Methanosarcina baikalica TaxID=3073890 RepID=A0ABU2CY99_9EURY|nr:hypothetical protein [Methanosarcina sp. Z-7115]MDR7664682.1 hypothetical protein [Methanosarcina sp. Z-7115]
MELINHIINGYRGSFHPRSKLAGYSTEINSISETRFKENNSSSGNTEPTYKIYLCRFLGLSITGRSDYKNCDELLLLTNVGMDNYSYCYYATEEDILRSGKIKILK